MQEDSIAALHLEIRNVLGTGSFAEVYECFDRKDNQIYAVKIISKQSFGSSKMKYFAKEAKILAEINHKNIVKFHSFHETEQCLLIKMEIIKGGTLKKMMQDRRKARKPFNQLQIAIFLKNLLEGVKYLHSLNVIHRDLKPENILFQDSSDLSTVKIVDFGLSAKLEVHNLTNIKSQCGTMLYMAPQIFYKPSYTKSVDIWSIAVITYMLFNDGNHPIYAPGMKIDEYKLKINNINFPSLSDRLAQNFIEKISKKQYEQRYNVNEALKHPFITRNKQDQIPLSIHQSFKGFDSTNQIILVMKLNLTINKLIEHRRIIIDEGYRLKVKDFVQNNEEIRVSSPSRKKIRDKHNQFFNKMKLMLNTNGSLENNQENNSKEQYKEQYSPTLKKHQSFFMSLFQKQKTFQLTQPQNDKKSINSSELNLKKVQNSYSFYNSFSDFQDKYQTESVIGAKSQRAINYENDYKKSDIENNLSKTLNFNNSYKTKLQHELQQSFKAIKLDLIQENPNIKRKIFQKKSLIEEKQSKIKYNPRLVKKYSFMNQKQKQQSSNFKISNKFSLSTKINNKKSSPGKQLPKPIFNNLPKYVNYSPRK